MVDCNHLTLKFEANSENFAPQRNPKKRAIASKINEILSSLRARIAAGSEPKVWTSINASGEVEWNAYDPFSGRSASGLTETQLRSWLENRYNC